MEGKKCFSGLIMSGIWLVLEVFLFGGVGGRGNYWNWVGSNKMFLMLRV